MFLFNFIPTTVRYVAFVCLCVIIVSVMSKWADSPVSHKSRLPKDGIKKIVETAAEYTNVGKQDSNPIVELMHTSYALAAVKSACRLMSASKLQRLTKCMDIDEWTRTLRGRQQRCVATLQKMMKTQSNQRK